MTLADGITESDYGRMAGVQDPTGAYIFFWKPLRLDESMEYTVKEVVVFAFGRGNGRLVWRLLYRSSSPGGSAMHETGVHRVLRWCPFRNWRDSHAVGIE